MLHRGQLRCDVQHCNLWQAAFWCYICVTLHSPVLYHSVADSSMLQCGVVNCDALHCGVLHHGVLHRGVLYCGVLHLVCCIVVCRSVVCMGTHLFKCMMPTGVTKLLGYLVRQGIGPGHPWAGRGPGYPNIYLRRPFPQGFKNQDKWVSPTGI